MKKKKKVSLSYRRYVCQCQDRHRGVSIFSVSDNDVLKSRETKKNEPLKQQHYSVLKRNHIVA